MAVFIDIIININRKELSNLKMIELKNNVPLTTTKIIEKYTGVRHQNILQLFRRHEESIKKFGVIMFETCKPKKGSKGGRPENYYYLNEEQLTFFVMLMANNEKVVYFKSAITQEFFKMKKTLLQIKVNQQNKEWLNSRTKGKDTRKLLTKEYQNYLKYAIENGSKTYEKRPKLVYSLFTDMINKVLFDFEFKPPKNKTRDFMTREQLNIVNSAELAAQKIIQDEINKKTEYHDIYQITKKKMKQYAEIVGKTTIIDLLTNSQISLLEE